MATFKCVRSGNLVSFTNEDDIAGLRKHEGYEEVLSKAVVEESKTLTIQKKTVKSNMPNFLQG